MSHTRTPWRSHNTTIFGPTTDGASQKFIGTTDSPFVRPTEAPANAAFIVKAVNAHDDLVKALAQIAARATAHPDDMDEDRKRQLYHITQLAQSALEKAGASS